MSSKTSPNKRKGIKVGIGFDLNTNITNFQIDFMSLMLDQDGKLLSDRHFIFYNNLKSPDNSVEHLSNILIEANKDDEQIVVDTEKISGLVKRIIFFANIHNAEIKNQTFEPIKNLYIRFTNLETKQEIAEYKPENDNDYKNSSLIVLAELVLVGSEWQISALGEGFRINLSEFIDILTNDYSYDKFKQEYSKTDKNNKGYSVKNLIEKEIEDRYYKILESSKENSDDEIKKKYKELVKSFHPDIIQTKNLHKDIVEFANKRFKEIKDAYDFIKSNRKFN